MPHNVASGAKPAGPCSLVIFGAAGDLTKRLVFPALYNLTLAQLLPAEFSIVGFDRENMDVDGWRKTIEQMLREFVAKSDSHPEFNEGAWKFLSERMSYMLGDLTKTDSYAELKKNLEGNTQTKGNYFFYLAVADSFFAGVVEQLGQVGLTKETGECWRRVVVEKPFGHDLKSAQDLNARILNVVKESQVFRIDHFLGKETVQNIIALRFGNSLFEPLWNRDRIDHVQITVSESVGVEKRGSFYERTGALRDMVPNHIFQLVAMTAMEAPNSMDPNAVRSEKTKVLEAVRVFENNGHYGMVRGQYTAGQIDGAPVPGYREEPGVDQNSNVETFAALKLKIDNWRWSGVPFYIRTGKHMFRRKTQIGIRFKDVPTKLLKTTEIRDPSPNWLLLRIQPDEGISLEFGAKIPGPTMNVEDVRMDFKYKDYFGSAPATGYETLIYDVMIGDATLFQRADNIEAGWRIVEPVLERWWSEDSGKKATSNELEMYAAGSQGPAGADALLAQDGRAWRPIH